MKSKKKILKNKKNTKKFCKNNKKYNKKKGGSNSNNSMNYNSNDSNSVNNDMIGVLLNDLNNLNRKEKEEKERIAALAISAPLSRDLLENIKKAHKYIQKCKRTNDDIRRAVRLWVTDRELAIRTYGHIKDWDTSEVNNMDYLFSDKDLLII